MRNKKNSLSQICLYFCIVLCFALIFVQMVFPFWTAEVSVKNADGERVMQEETLSLWGFLSFPEDDVQKQFNKNFTATYGDAYDINDVAGTGCLVLILGVVSIIFILLKPNKAWTFMFPLACGISGVIGYLTQPVLQAGNLWIVHLILSCLIIVGTVIPCIHFIKAIKSWLTEEG